MERALSPAVRRLHPWPTIYHVGRTISCPETDSRFQHFPETTRHHRRRCRGRFYQQQQQLQQLQLLQQILLQKPLLSLPPSMLTAPILLITTTTITTRTTTTTITYIYINLYSPKNSLVTTDRDRQTQKHTE